MDYIKRIVLVPIMLLLNMLRLIDERTFHSRLDVIAESKVIL